MATFPWFLEMVGVVVQEDLRVWCAGFAEVRDVAKEATTGLQAGGEWSLRVDIISWELEEGGRGHR